MCRCGSGHLCQGEEGPGNTGRRGGTHEEAQEGSIGEAERNQRFHRVKHLALECVKRNVEL